MVDRIKALCAEKGLSMYRLEKMLGFAHNSIVKWDRHSPSIDKVVYVAEFFGVTVDDLVKEEK